MGRIAILTEQDLRRVVGFGSEELDSIEAVYPLISTGQASMPPIMRIDVPEHNGEIDVKSAYLPGYAGIAVKVSAGFFDNPRKGLPSLGGLMMVFDSETGIPRAALFDNGFLTDLRTALAGAVAARHLARDDASRVAVLGGGVQARLQLRALTLVRPIRSAVVWARREEQASEYAVEMAELLSIPVDVAASASEAVSNADLVVTTTPATEPILDEVGVGVHVTAVGSDAEHKCELSPHLVDSADLVVCDSIAQGRRLGELRRAVEEGFDPDRAVELGAVIDGSHPGRTDAAQVTICDLTGTGAQDTAISALAVTRAAVAGVGAEFET